MSPIWWPWEIIMPSLVVQCQAIWKWLRGIWKRTTEIEAKHNCAFTLNKGSWELCPEQWCDGQHTITKPIKSLKLCYCNFLLELNANSESLINKTTKICLYWWKFILWCYFIDELCPRTGHNTSVLYLCLCLHRSDFYLDDTWCIVVTSGINNNNTTKPPRHRNILHQNVVAWHDVNPFSVQ